MRWSRKYQYYNDNDVCTHVVEVGSLFKYHKVTYRVHCFFLIGVDVVDASVNCDLILFVDDSALLVSGREIALTQDISLGSALAALQDWLVLTFGQN